MPVLDRQLKRLDKEVAAEDGALGEAVGGVALSYGARESFGEALRPSVAMQLEIRRLRLLIQRESLLKAVVERSVLWPDPALPVCWEASARPFATERAWVQDAALSSWPAQSAVSFHGWGSCEPDSGGVRIAVDNDTEASTAGLGIQLDGLRNGITFRFDFSDWNRSCVGSRETCIRAIAVHEFGHVLGLTHEQNRDEAEGWCADLAEGHSGDWSVTVYDQDSIMNYCSPTYLRSDLLSELDIEAVQTIYGRA